MKEYRVIMDDNLVQFLTSVRRSLKQGWRFEQKGLTMGQLSKHVIRKRSGAWHITLVKGKR